MNCPRCNQPTDPGAAFCGNCGQALTAAGPTLPQPMPQFAGVPAYAQAAPLQHQGETKALLSLIFGVLGLPAALVPLIGLLLGIAGLVLGTLSRHSAKRLLSTLGILFSVLAIIASLAMWAHTISTDKLTRERNSPSGNNTAAVATAAIKTPCYNINFVQSMNTDYDQSDSCDVRAYEGASIAESNDVYKIYGNLVPAITDDNFYNVAKNALEKDISATLPNFTIDAERTAQFAGSPAYIVNASDSKNQIAVVEAAVFHKVGSGYNVFSLVHATKGPTTDLKTLERQWQWK